MSKSKVFVAAALALAGTLAAGAAQARDDVQWSVTIGTPVYTQPVYSQQPVYTQPAPVYRYPAPVYQQDRYQHYRQPTRWDRDGDGIPNRYDRVYNPRWDRDGDGIPNRYDRNDRRNWDRDRDGIPNWQDRYPRGR